MKLRDIPRDSRINVEASDGSTFITFKHLDGMYSLCYTENGNPVHLAGFTPLKLVSEGVYEIVEESGGDKKDHESNI